MEKASSTGMKYLHRKRDSPSLLQALFLLVSTSAALQVIKEKKSQYSMEKLCKMKTKFPFEFSRLFTF